MSLHKEIISREIGKMMIDLLDKGAIDYSQIVEQESLAVLERIKAVIADSSLSDFDCVEQIVRVFEEIGSSCGTRHDF
ncbi:MAG: hypothetical protein FWC96_01635 [Oscillospiraceae bacterium]|nr:hypothetical protein [Oscillospiraceae bacterium]